MLSINRVPRPLPDHERRPEFERGGAWGPVPGERGAAFDVPAWSVSSRSEFASASDSAAKTKSWSISGDRISPEMLQLDIGQSANQPACKLPCADEGQGSLLRVACARSRHLHLRTPLRAAIVLSALLLSGLRRIERRLARNAVASALFRSGCIRLCLPNRHICVIT